MFKSTHVSDFENVQVHGAGTEEQITIMDQKKKALKNKVLVCLDASLAV